MMLQRGDVILCHVPMLSTELAGYKMRPAIVVSKNVNNQNQRLDDIIIAPCTSNISRSREPTQFLIDGAEISAAGIRVSSIVRCESLMALPKSLIVRSLGHLSASALDAVDDCLRDALTL